MPFITIRYLNIKYKWPPQPLTDKNARVLPFHYNYFISIFFSLLGDADKVKTLIRLRAELSPLFTGKRNASKYAWTLVFS